MYLAKYLLNITEFTDAENGEALLARAFLHIDAERKRKALGIRPGKARAASVGAGLLLQAAVRDGDREACSQWRRYSVNELMDILQEKPPLELAYVCGREGKPYFRDLPFYFNLSHSGDYVLCVVSAAEIGADIQQHGRREGGKGKAEERSGVSEQNAFRDNSAVFGKLASRFFSERECDALNRAGAEGEKLFFRLWARKEAYGKLTGKGVTGVLGMDMLPETGQEEDKLLSGEGGFSREKGISWEEYGSIEGYSIALCHYG